MEKAVGARLESGLSSGGTGEPLMVLEQDTKESRAVLSGDGVTREIRYIFRRSLCCFVDIGSQWDRSMVGDQLGVCCHSQVKKLMALWTGGVAVKTERGEVG